MILKTMGRQRILTLEFKGANDAKEKEKACEREKGKYHKSSWYS